MAKDYDLIVLGGGTGGYVAAIRASQLGMKVAVVEKDKLGGTCLHRGCIPSKALLRSASLLHWVREAENLGIYPGEVTFDFRKMQEKKEEIVTRLYRGVTYLLKKNRIDVFQGTGSIASSQPLSLVVEQAQEGQLVLTGKNLLLATGARPRSLPNFPIDGEYLITSDEILTLEKLPDTLLIVGGGVIGIEWASMLSDLGVKITIVEAANRILPGEDLDIRCRSIAGLLSREFTDYF
jgi:dihydrolipoamide dehydrogenase